MLTQVPLDPGAVARSGEEALLLEAPSLWIRVGITIGERTVRRRTGYSRVRHACLPRQVSCRTHSSLHNSFLQLHGSRWIGVPAGSIPKICEPRPQALVKQQAVSAQALDLALHGGVGDTELLGDLAKTTAGAHPEEEGSKQVAASQPVGRREGL